MNVYIKRMVGNNVVRDMVNMEEFMAVEFVKDDGNNIDIIISKDSVHRWFHGDISVRGSNPVALYPIASNEVLIGSE